jgi:hypothetical protein
VNLKNIIYLIIIIAINASLVFSCSSADEAQKRFEQEAFRGASGFTQTNSSGQIISNDPDDWRVSPLFAGFVEVSPIYPNPTTGEIVTLELLVLSLNTVNGIDIGFFDDFGNFILLNFDERIPLPTGPTGFFLDPRRINPSGTIAGAVGLHRIFIFDRRGNLISYGDIKVE